MESDKQVVLVAQKTPSEDNPSIADIYEVGTSGNDPAAA